MENKLKRIGEELVKEYSRDALTRFFMPALLQTRMKSESKKEIHSEYDCYAKEILGVKELTRIPCRHAKMVNECSRVYMKMNEFYTIYQRYTKIFDLCRAIGVANIYDIGCQTINQSFLLIDNTKMTYTGINDNGFDLNDFMIGDLETNFSEILSTDAPPPSFCSGRIRFISGHYPDIELAAPENNIAVACYSFTFCRTENEIKHMVESVMADFDRVLFNIYNPKIISEWKKQDWRGYMLVPIGPMGFVLATRNSEDIQRMKVVYEWKEGRFVTGIDSSVDVFVGLNKGKSDHENIDQNERFQMYWQ